MQLFLVKYNLIHSKSLLVSLQLLATAISYKLYSELKLLVDELAAGLAGTTSRLDSSELLF